MKAAIFKEAGMPVSIEDRPDPEPGAGEVILRVGRCGVCGTDLHMSSGCNSFAFRPDSMFGHEYAGEVVALGKNVSKLKIGDKVAAMPMAGCGKCPACYAGFLANCPETRAMSRGFAQYIAAADRSAVLLPSSLSLADGALVEPLSVGLHGVGVAGIEAGTRVLVLGAGSVGLAAMFWARRAGAGRIVAVSPSTRRAELAGIMGADAFEALGEEEGQRISNALGGEPDIVFECAGAAGSIEKSIELVKRGGTVVSLGFCTFPDQILPHIATLKQVTLKFSLLYTLREFQHCVDVLDRGHVEPRSMISLTVPLQALPQTLEELRSGSRHTKVQVDPWSEENSLAQ